MMLFTFPSGLDSRVWNRGTHRVVGYLCLTRTGQVAASRYTSDFMDSNRLLPTFRNKEGDLLFSGG